MVDVVSPYAYLLFCFLFHFWFKFYSLADSYHRTYIVIFFPYRLPVVGVALVYHLQSSVSLQSGTPSVTTQPRAMQWRLFSYTRISSRLRSLKTFWICLDLRTWVRLHWMSCNTLLGFIYILHQGSIGTNLTQYIWCNEEMWNAEFAVWRGRSTTIFMITSTSVLLPL